LKGGGRKGKGVEKRKKSKDASKFFNVKRLKKTTTRKGGKEGKEYPKSFRNLMKRAEPREEKKKLDEKRQK